VTSGLVSEFLPAQAGVDGWSLFPPLVAILTAAFTGQLILGLRRALVDFIWLPVWQSFQLYILAFTTALIGMVRVVSLAGGTQGIAEVLAARADGARSTRIATYLLGMAIFFDDYANTLVVGTTMRPIADRFRVSREKLAYLVDSTAAPVAGVAVISTWIGYEVGYFDQIMQDLGTGISGYELFFRALPARFYCLLTLTFVGLSVLLRRDFGPMLKAERRARRTGQVLAPGARPMSGSGTESLPAPEGIKPHWLVAVLPVLTVVLGVVVGMQVDAWGAPEVAAARQEYSAANWRYWSVVFSHAEGARVMFFAALAGSLLAFGMALSRRNNLGHRPLRPLPILRTWVEGIIGFRHALVILILAWAIREACNAVGTSDYLLASLGTSLRPEAVPVIIFLLASLVAFSIGTSWATMAILLPTGLPLAHELGGLPLTVLAAAAVLDGAIFGDHCSPISDTTVLSSIASSCDHLHHVKTQFPYAVVTMAIAALVGYLGTALAYPSYVGLALGVGCVTAVLLVAGSDPDAVGDGGTGSQPRT